MKEDVAIFEHWRVRRIFDEASETWYFSVVDIIGVLTDQPDARGATFYWGTLKKRLKAEGSEVLTNCQHFKLTAQDGKKRLTDVANAETLRKILMKKK